MPHEIGATDPENSSAETVVIARPDYSLHLAHLGAIVESSDDAIISKSLDGTIRSWNGAASRTFGYTSEEAIGQSILLIIPPELHSEEQQILEKLRGGEPIKNFDTIRLTKDGRRIPIALSVSPVCDARGVIVGASKIARDISERKRAEDMIKRSEDALRAANRRKDEFIALIAHELRNALAPIRYAVAPIKKADGTAEQQTHAREIIERQSAHMSRLLDDLLDISRITQGKLELRKAATELTTVLGAAVEAARPILDAKQHVLSLNLPKHAVRLLADADRLTQVFSNLLNNAAKYTNVGGHVEIRVEQTEESIVVSVSDDGIGISQEMMPKLFAMFAQDDAAASLSRGGLGIGLSLAQGIMSLHGGTVEAHSQGAGRGSEFVVTIPAGIPRDSGPGEAKDNDAPAASRGLRILVVDDNRDAADSCSILLELSGHHVQTAYTARQAIELACTSRPHVILSDIGLPDMDGYDLAREIRSTPWGQQVALVAITGWGQAEAKRKALDAGFTHHLMKPVGPEILESLLQSLSADLYSLP